MGTGWYLGSKANHSNGLDKFTEIVGNISTHFSKVGCVGLGIEFCIVSLGPPMDRNTNAVGSV